MMRQFAGTPVTKYCKLRGLNNSNIMPPSSGESVWEITRAVREGPIPDLSPWLVDGHLLPVSPHIILPLCISISKFPLLIRMPVILD